jgi:glycine cleavage system aminomethyltransferase T
MSWKEACYVHAGLSGSGPLVLRGPDAAQFLESLCINSFAKFPVGSMKHGVMCQADGLIATHGIIERKADDEFQFFAAGMWPRQQLDGTSWKVETTVLDQYLFQIPGPASLQVLERATGESLSDIRFLRFSRQQD